MASFKNKHLSLEDRIIIQKGLENSSSKSAIASTIGKNKSTVSREVKNHRYLVSNNFNGASVIRDCLFLADCNKSICKHPCDKYKMQPCPRRDRIIGVCNSCDSFTNGCQKTKYRYDAHKANDEYLYDLKDSRIGVDLTTSQAKQIADIIKPLIDQGQSIYSIVKNHPELNICEKTLYNYIEAGVFSSNGLIDLDLPRKVNRYRSKTKIVCKPRENRAYLKNRKYSDFEKFTHDHPTYNIVEMDTVYNDGSDGPFIQTFQIVSLNLMIGIFHENKTAQSMLNGLKLIKEWLGDEYFIKLFRIILTDRGPEFSCADEIEKLGVNIFYCDPMCSHQKPHVEENHTLLRRILPKKKDLKLLGLESQDDLNLIFSHINSYIREVLNDKNPIEVLEFFYDDSQSILDRLRLTKIDKDKVILKPYLIKKS